MTVSPIAQAITITPHWMMVVHDICTLSVRRIPACPDAFGVYAMLKQGGTLLCDAFPTEAAADAFIAKLKSIFPHLA